MLYWVIWFDLAVNWNNVIICISMGGQLDGNFLPGSLPHKFILFVTLIICFVVNKFLSPQRGPVVLKI